MATNTGQRKRAAQRSGSKYDWPLIERDYVEGYIDEETGARHFPSYKDLEAKYRTGKNTVTTRATNEQWPHKREAFLKQLEESRRALLAETLARKGLDIDATCVELAEMGLTEVRRHFTEFRAYLERLASETDKGKIEEGAMATLYPAIDLDRIGRALERFQKVSRLALGETTENVSQTVKDGEKLVEALQDYSSVFRELAETSPVPVKEGPEEDEQPHVVH